MLGCEEGSAAWSGVGLPVLTGVTDHTVSRTPTERPGSPAEYSAGPRLVPRLWARCVVMRREAVRSVYQELLREETCPCTSQN